MIRARRAASRFWRYRFTIDEIIAEGERVVVLGRGEVKTRSGKDY